MIIFKKPQDRYLENKKVRFLEKIPRVDNVSIHIDFDTALEDED